MKREGLVALRLRQIFYHRTYLDTRSLRGKRARIGLQFAACRCKRCR